MESAFLVIEKAADDIGRFFSARLHGSLRSVAIAILVMAVLAPALLSAGSVSYASMTYRLESVFCHQVPSRCIWICGEPTALCARCLGGYFGFLLASFLFSGRFDPGKAVRSGIAILAFAGLIDIYLHCAGVYDTGNGYRLVSGISVGSGLGMVAFRFISDIERTEQR
jgi:uncharacterized membrane protein